MYDLTQHSIDMLLTIASWTLGPIVFMALLIVYSFASASRGGGIIAFVSFGLALWLAWMGVSSIYHTFFPALKEKIVQAVNKIQTTHEIQNPIQTHNTSDIQLTIVYFVVSIGFLFWLLTPSKERNQSKDAIRESFLSKIFRQKDPNGWVPFSPDPQSLEDKEKKEE